MPRFSQTSSSRHSMQSLVAATQVADRQDAALTSRTARRLQRERRNQAALAAERIVLRPAALQDGAAVAALAALDDAERPAGDLLIAELDGRIVAAVSLDGGRAIADPFRLTGDLVELLRRRAGQINAHHAPRRTLLRSARFSRA